MKKESTKRRDDDDLRPEYDLAQLKGSVRGKYYQQATAGTNRSCLSLASHELFQIAAP